MNDRGVFAVSRGVFDHPVFAPEPYTEREAWLWMIGAAAWKAQRVRVGRKVFDLARGQLAFSERFLAEKWRWAKSHVHRFLNRLKSEAMIVLLADREATHITICNYDRYAFDGTARGPQSEPLSEPPADHPRTKEEEINNSKKEEDGPKRVRTLYSDEFEQRFWQPYPRTPVMSKSEAWRAWQKLSAGDRSKAVEALPRFTAWLASQRDHPVVHACRFLSQRRFDGFDGAALTPAQNEVARYLA